VLYALIIAVVFAETAVLLGMVLPGETAAIVAGVLASQHQLNLGLVIPLVVVAAVAGDSTGYALGRYLGRWLLALKPLRKRRVEVDRATATLRRRGWVLVVVSRFIPFLRTVTPAAAGISRMRYLAFVPASLAGGVLWGVGCPALGYLAADSYRHVEEVVGPSGIVLLAVVLLSAWVVRATRRRRGKRTVPDTESAAVPAEPAESGEPAERSERSGSGVLARPRRRTTPDSDRRKIP
jgi:membrane protein DedA with SNARE-associated domain